MSEISNPKHKVPSTPRGVSRRLILPAALALSLGVLAGLGTFTFGYAQGFSYLSNDPNACTNCHVMQPHYDSWQKSPHHHVAVCNDCHLPHHPVGKYVTKADNGFFHSLAFTTDSFHEPIRIKPRNRTVTNNACIHCHQGLVDQILPVHAHAHNDDSVLCIHCHANVGHGP